MRRARVWIVAVTLLVLACGSCGEGSDPPSGSPSVSSPPSVTKTPSATPTTPTYLEKYSQAERVAYADALRDYTSYRAREARFERSATAPVAARTFYRNYTADWQTYWAVRKHWAANGIRVVGVPTVLWSRPVLIRLGHNSEGSVQFRQCVDASKVAVTQRGRAVPQNKKPTLSTISMSKLASDPFWKFLGAKEGRPC